MGVRLSRMTTNNEIGPTKFCYNTSSTLPKQSQNLDPSFKTDLDFGIVLEGEKLCLIIEEIRYKSYVFTVFLMYYCLSCD